MKAVIQRVTSASVVVEGETVGEIGRGILVLLGMNTQFQDQPLVGNFCGTGMHGGAIFLRGTVEPWQVGKECGIFTADEEDMQRLTPILTDYAESLGLDAAEILAGTFTKLIPVSHRPYGKLYAPQ